MHEWTLELFESPLPRFRAEDDIVVVEDTATGRIVSSVLLIPQDWSYAGVVVPVGQPELVATDPAYRRRGLIREQFAEIHRRSQAVGDLWQVIGGIPWYYRQFGYAYALDLPPVPVWRPPGKVPDPPADIALRAAALTDLPFLARVDAHGLRDGLGCLRDEAAWRYELTHRRRLALGAGAPRRRALDRGGTRADRLRRPHLDAPRRQRHDLGLRAGAGRELAGADGGRPPPPRRLGPEPPRRPWRGRPAPRARGPSGPPQRCHRAHRRSPRRLRPLRPHDRSCPRPHRGPDGAGGPVGAVAAVGHTGEVVIDLYTGTLRLGFEDGRLQAVMAGGPRPAAAPPADVSLPAEWLLHLVLGNRSLAELQATVADCLVETDTGALIVDAVFPRMPLFPWTMG